ncbi:CRISPR-associated helicase Cas3' [Infirmifilum sp.]|uniref:CRISPR-associated helicase Cas3' n=1 Tax=Infirmifilum sp. TaxID=2856575 RepID=UPI003D140A24
MNLRPGVGAVLEELNRVAAGLAKGERVLLHVSLPTGYGKSTASIILASVLGAGSEIPSGLAERLEQLADYAVRVVHVVPTRALVEDLVRRARERRLKARGQCMMFDPSLKDPFFLSSLVFTTFDSYALNFFKVPVSELELMRAGWTRGHYDLPRYSILSALNVFDEYHMLAPGDTGAETPDYGSRSLATLEVVIKHLLECRVPTILMTATPNRQVLDKLRESLGSLRLAEVALAFSRGSCGGQGCVKAVYDEEFTQKLTQARYSTEVTEGRLPDMVSKRAGSMRRPLLIACNTVSEAVEVYKRVREKGEVVLLHSLFTVGHRKQKLEKLRKLLKGGKREEVIVVSTQVIEVGVDLDFASLLTDAAPLSSLVQRVGRVNRELREGESEVVVVFDPEKQRHGLYVGVYSWELTRRTVECLSEIHGKGKEVGWRMSVLEGSVEVDGKEILTVSALSQHVYSSMKLYEDTRVRQKLGQLLHHLISSQVAMGVLDELGSFVRDDMLVPVYVPDEEFKEKGALDRFEYSRVVPCPAAKLGLFSGRKTIARSIIQTINGKPLVIAEGPEGFCVMPVEDGKVKEGVKRGLFKLDNHLYFLRALVAKPDAYSRELGLKVWRFTASEARG